MKGIKYTIKLVYKHSTAKDYKYDLDLKYDANGGFNIWLVLVRCSIV